VPSSAVGMIPRPVGRYSRRGGTVPTEPVGWLDVMGFIARGIHS
jgi:hypothetical protein